MIIHSTWNPRNSPLASVQKSMTTLSLCTVMSAGGLSPHRVAERRDKWNEVEWLICSSFILALCCHLLTANVSYRCSKLRCIDHLEIIITGVSPVKLDFKNWLEDQYNLKWGWWWWRWWAHQPNATEESITWASEVVVIFQRWVVSGLYKSGHPWDFITPVSPITAVIKQPPCASGISTHCSASEGFPNVTRKTRAPEDLHSYHSNFDMRWNYRT